jgi:hypothetical protein
LLKVAKVAIYYPTKKKARLKNKKLASQILRYFFCDVTIIDFPKVFWDFRKWTFIFVHFLISEKGFGAKNRIFAKVWEVGTFGFHATK